MSDDPVPDGPDERADGGPPVRYDQRPIDDTPVHTADLPATPVRDRNIPAHAWVEAPEALLRAGEDIGEPGTTYKRRIGRWLLWRAGGARKVHARYVAVDSEDLERTLTFRLYPDGTGDGVGPSGQHHGRFRTWKEDLRDHGRPISTTGVVEID
jgi:hypothetical protein